MHAVVFAVFGCVFEHDVYDNINNSIEKEYTNGKFLFSPPEQKEPYGSSLAI